jgi:hypothetical protein
MDVPNEHMMRSTGKGWMPGPETTTTASGWRIRIDATSPCSLQCDTIIRFTTNLSRLKKGSPVNPPDTRMKDYLKESHTTHDPAEVVTNTEKIPPDNNDIYS